MVKDVRALWVRLAHLGHLALQDSRDLWAQLVSMVLMAQTARLVLRDYRGLQAPLDLPVSLVFLVLREYRGRLALRVLVLLLRLSCGQQLQVSCGWVNYNMFGKYNNDCDLSVHINICVNDWFYSKCYINRNWFSIK